MRRTVFLCLVILMVTAARAQALSIVVGKHKLLPNTPGQRIAIYVTGGELVNGMSLSVSVNNGGAEYGGKPGPLITGIDVDAGPTIWNQHPGHNPPSISNEGQLWNVNFLTVDGYVSAEGLLATLKIDTTGFFGEHTLELSGGTISETLGDTQFLGQDLELTIINGSFGDGTGQLGMRAVGLPTVAVLAAAVMLMRRRRRARIA